MNWRPPTFTDLQLHSGFDPGPSAPPQADGFSGLGANPFDLQRAAPSKLLSPEALRSRRSSPDRAGAEGGGKSFAEKIFKNLAQPKGPLDLFGQKKPEPAFPKTGNARKRPQSQMMQSIAEQNETANGGAKAPRPQSRGFYFASHTLSRLTKKKSLGDSAAIEISINEKKKHAFNPAFNVESGSNAAKLPLTQPRPRKMHFEFGMGKEERLQARGAQAGTLKTYAADTGSMGKYGRRPEARPLDSRFKIPNHFTPARIGQGFMDAQPFPLISGGEPNPSDLAGHFIGKREFTFAREAPLAKRPKPEAAALFVASRASDLSNRRERSQTKFSKEAPADVFLEEASGSKMSNSRFRIETEKED